MERQMKPTKQQLEKFRKQHIHEAPIPETKWLGNMSKEEIRNGYEEVQRELNGENNE